LMPFANSYLTMLDMQSSSVVLTLLKSEAPRVQSLVDIRKAYLLEGLGIMGMVHSYVFAVTLYPLVEYSGFKDSEVISEAANKALLRLSNPKSLNDFLSQHLSQVMNELSVRILNLTIHPNCPNALIFLAEFFDFRQTAFVNLIEQVLSRSCDPFCGGSLQQIYAKVFYSFMLSLWKHSEKEAEPELKSTSKKFISFKFKKPLSLKDRLIEYQKSIGMDPASEHMNRPISIESESVMNEEYDQEDSSTENSPKPLSSHLNLALKISHRVLNFLPSDERSVRLLGMECIIKGIYILQSHEDSLLPLAHTIWQNLIPR